MHVNWVKRVYGGNPNTVLEVGCGPVGLIKHLGMSRRVAVDPLLNEFRKDGFPIDEHYRGCELLPSSAEDVVLDGQFDLVLCLNVLDHCMDAEKVLRRLVAWTKPDGALILRSDLRSRNGGSVYHPIVFTREDVNRVFSEVGMRVIAEYKGPPISPLDAECEGTWLCGDHIMGSVPPYDGYERLR